MERLPSGAIAAAWRKESDDLVGNCGRAVIAGIRVAAVAVGDAGRARSQAAPCPLNVTEGAR